MCTSKVIFFICVFTIGEVLSNSYQPLLGNHYQVVQPAGPAIKPKQTIQQFQVSVVLPPGANPPQTNQPPNSSPEYVWLQIPASYLTGQSPAGNPNPFQTVKPPSAAYPAVQQPPQLPPAKPDQPQTPSSPSAPIENLSFPVTQQLPTTSTATPVGVSVPKCLSPRGQFPSNFCNKYVNCWDGVAVEQFCPPGLVFNSKGYCDYPYNVNCGGKPVVEPPPPSVPNDGALAPGQISSSTQAPTTVAPPTVIVTLPTIDPSLRRLCLRSRGQFRSNSCNKYVNCWDDVVIEQDCPDGLLFSNRGYCDYPVNVDCKNATAPSRSSDTKSNGCLAEFGTFREKTNCSNYFTCIGGEIVARYTCPEGFNFNDNIGVCDWAERVDCSKEPLIFSPKSNFLANIPKDFMQKVETCNPGSIFALNPQCTTACICREGISEIVQCPSGLAYDTNTDKCLLPHLAKC